MYTFFAWFFATAKFFRMSPWNILGIFVVALTASSVAGYMVGLLFWFLTGAILHLLVNAHSPHRDRHGADLNPTHPEKDSK